MNDLTPEQRADQIDDILDALHEHWATWPELRLGQLLSNIAGTLGLRENDPYYLEDRVLLAWLRGVDLRPATRPGETPHSPDPA